jgi:hypothetical protein
MGRKKRTKPNEEAVEPPVTIVDPPTFAPPPAVPPDRSVKQEVLSSRSIQIKSASIKKVPDVELGEKRLLDVPLSLFHFRQLISSSSTHQTKPTWAPNPRACTASIPTLEIW